MDTIFENPKRRRHRMNKKKLIRTQISRVKRKEFYKNGFMFALSE